MKNSLFLDTSYAIALAVIDDQHNHAAFEFARKIETQNIPLITTQAILLEIGNSLSKRHLRPGRVYDALTTDEYFIQAGFRALLREETI